MSKVQRQRAGRARAAAVVENNSPDGVCQTYPTIALCIIWGRSSLDKKKNYNIALVFRISYIRTYNVIISLNYK